MLAHKSGIVIKLYLSLCELNDRCNTFCIPPSVNSNEFVPDIKIYDLRVGFIQNKIIYPDRVLFAEAMCCSRFGMCLSLVFSLLISVIIGVLIANFANFNIGNLEYKFNPQTKTLLYDIPIEYRLQRNLETTEVLEITDALAVGLINNYTVISNMINVLETRRSSNLVHYAELNIPGPHFSFLLWVYSEPEPPTGAILYKMADWMGQGIKPIKPVYQALFNPEIISSEYRREMVRFEDPYTPPHDAPRIVYDMSSSIGIKVSTIGIYENKKVYRIVRDKVWMEGKDAHDLQLILHAVENRGAKFNSKN